MIYLLALIPPLLDSIANYLDKFLLSKYSTAINPTALTIFSGFFAFLTGMFIYILTGLFFVDIKTSIILTASGFLGVFYLLFYFKALTYDEGSRVGALFQFVPVIVLILSFIILGEKLLLKQYIGSFFIIFAGFLISVRKLETGVFTINKAFWFMLLSGTFSALVYVLFKLGVQQVGFWGSLPYEGFGAGLATLTLLVYGNNFTIFKKTITILNKRIITYMMIIELLARISRYILFFVLTLIPASIASVLMGFQPLFLLIIGVILSVWFPHILKEVVTKKTISLKIFSAVFILIGLCLIFL